MEALTCDSCSALGTPQTMYAIGVDYDPNDGVSYGPICFPCGEKWMREQPGPVVLDRWDEWTDGGPIPNDVDLDDWIDEHGQHDTDFVAECEAQAQEMILAGEIAVSDTLVPYGSTVVSASTDFDMPESILRGVALQWWESWRIEWGAEIGPELKDGSRHFWLVPHVTEKKED